MLIVRPIGSCHVLFGFIFFLAQNKVEKIVKKEVEIVGERNGGIRSSFLAMSSTFPLLV